VFSGGMGDYPLRLIALWCVSVASDYRVCVLGRGGGMGEKH
jgi:hypothetical protein